MLGLLGCYGLLQAVNLIGQPVDHAVVLMDFAMQVHVLLLDSIDVLLPLHNVVICPADEVIIVFSLDKYWQAKQNQTGQCSPCFHRYK